MTKIICLKIKHRDEYFVSVLRYYVIFWDFIV